MINEIVSAALTAVLFFVFGRYVLKATSTDANLALASVGYAVILVILNGLLPIAIKEGYGEPVNTFVKYEPDSGVVADDVNNPVSDLSRMKGGVYMFQGDDAISQKYRQMMKTPQGQQQVFEQNCSKGFVGAPLQAFEYTGQTNEKWQNPQCSS